MRKRLVLVSAPGQPLRHLLCAELSVGRSADSLRQEGGRYYPHLTEHRRVHARIMDCIEKQRLLLVALVEIAEGPRVEHDGLAVETSTPLTRRHEAHV